MKRLIKWAIPIVILLVAISYGLVSYLIASGVTKAERKDQEDHPSVYGLVFEEVEFPSLKGDVTLSGWYLPGNTARSTIVFVHGIGSIRSGDRAVDLAGRLVDRGYNVLLFDLRAHGSSGGDKVSGGFYEQQDALGAIDFLVGRGTPIESIGVLGLSMGAGTSALAVAAEPSIRALVIDSSYANASELIGQEIDRKTVLHYTVPLFLPTVKVIAKHLYGIDLGALVPEQAVGRLGYPILVIHGMADTRIPFNHGERVYQAAHPQSKI